MEVIQLVTDCVQPTVDTLVQLVLAAVVLVQGGGTVLNTDDT